MAIPISYYGQKINDNTLKDNGTPESGSWAIPITTLTAANLTAKETLIGNLATALEALYIGNLAQVTVTLDRHDVSTAPAGSSLAQRENKFLFRYHGTTLNQKFQVSIPTADLTKLMTNSEFIDLSTGPGAAVKAAFQDIAVSPDDSSESVILDSIQFVGRNT